MGGSVGWGGEWGEGLSGGVRSRERVLLFRVVKDGRHIFPELPNFIKSEGVHKVDLLFFLLGILLIHWMLHQKGG